MIAESLSNSTSTITSSVNNCSPLSQFVFPRTGKRGVPQQFPRRLYEMIDTETRNAETDVQYIKYIAWSNSGKAFRITNVTDFSSIVLPKYFRTKKFSSFQRNLNLYGFTKVRKGIDTDMYAHPSFLRDRPDALLHLQKTSTSSSSTTTCTTVPKDDERRVCILETTNVVPPRSVSPSCFLQDVNDAHKKVSRTKNVKKIVLPTTNHRITVTTAIDELLKHRSTPVSPHSQHQQQRSIVGSTSCCSDSDASSTGSNNDRGKLDLLAFALEHEHEFSFYH